MRTTFKGDDQGRFVCATLDKEAADRLVLLYNRARKRHQEEGKRWWIPDTPKAEKDGLELYIGSPRARHNLEQIIELSSRHKRGSEDKKMFDALTGACNYYQWHFVRFFKSDPGESRGWRLGTDVFSG